MSVCLWLKTKEVSSPHRKKSVSSFLSIWVQTNNQAQTLALDRSLHGWPLHLGISPCGKDCTNTGFLLKWFPPSLHPIPSPLPPPPHPAPIPSPLPPPHRVIYVPLRAFSPSEPIWPSCLSLQRGCNPVFAALPTVSMEIMTILQLLWSHITAD